MNRKGRKMKALSHITSRRSAGFTLPELLAVVCIISLLMTASFGALARARKMARITKAEVQLRELINAWTQYYTTYEEWPSNMEGARDVDATGVLLAPLTDANHADNPYGIVFLNFSGSGPYRDPWGQMYRLSTSSGGNSSSGREKGLTILETTVALPKRIVPIP